ncbi:hypothetical protein [Laspinema olomoucense]|uniref:hypothetical protein n=1 Tax=Laspinema olomoucense TaxID=3231600 RepID=UPI0021BB36B0|nr:hypothetical protein [Laspinema sp. D3c]
MVSVMRETPWQDLLKLFYSSEHLTEDVFIQKIRSLDLPKKLRLALEASIKGNNRVINEYLFNLPVTYQYPVAWVAPVLINSQKRYAWMVGQISLEISEVRYRFHKASSSVCDDPLLLCKREPMPLMFIEPFAVSKFSDISALSDISRDAGDFAIFQVGYKNTNGDIKDFDQSLVLNSTLLNSNLNCAIRRASKVLNELQGLEISLQKESKLFSMCHAEAHNRGHFAGSWTFDDDKRCVLHEAVEEFRACLNAIRWSEHLGFSHNQLNLFAFSVFVNRFFYQGYNSYVNPVKTHQSVREISVGLMFFEVLKKFNVFHFSKTHFSLNEFKLDLVRPSLIAALEIINQQESDARHRGIDGLRDVGRYWYQLAYPKADLSPEAQSIYTNLRQSRID